MIRELPAWAWLALLAAFQVSAGCIDCHGGLAVDAIPQSARLAAGAAGCVLCHGGDPGADDEQSAHRGAPASLARGGGPREFYADPGDLSAAGHACGQCHAGYGARWTKSIMSTEAGLIERGLCADGWHRRRARGGGPAAFGRYGIGDEDGSEPSAGTPDYKGLMRTLVAAKPAMFPPVLHAVPAHHRSELESCNGCHDAAPSVPRPGCSACHSAHAADAGLHEVRHDDAANPAGAAAVPIDRCFHCHFDPRTTARNDIGDAVLHYGGHGSDGTPAGEGLWCQDCHTSIEMHGDGNIPASPNAQREIRCEDCHGTLDKRPWELPLMATEDTGGEDSVRPPRGVADAHGNRIDVVQPGQPAYLLTSRGNVFGNVVRVDDGAYLRSVSGRVYKVRLLAQLAEQDGWHSERARQVKSAPELHAGFGCMDCHADWLPPCVGCHAEATTRQVPEAPAGHGQVSR